MYGALSWVRIGKAISEHTKKNGKSLVRQSKCCRQPKVAIGSESNKFGEKRFTTYISCTAFVP